MKQFVTILLRAVRRDQKLQGYQLTGYINKEEKRVQFVLVNLAQNENWKMSVDTAVLSNHKMMVSTLIWCHRLAFIRFLIN